MELQREVVSFGNDQLICEFERRNVNTVILHGAGKSNRGRFYPFAAELLRRGSGVILFDFSGQGESSGDLLASSLALRMLQAQTVINTLTPADSPLHLIGFSMSAQTVCDLLPTYRPRVRSILLGCPAIYTEEAEQLPFGNVDFTNAIRSPQSWQRSRAPSLLKSFSGKTIVATGSEDQIIPSQVPQLLRKSAVDVVYKEYSGVDHQLAVWLGEQPAELASLIAELIV